MSPPAQSPLVRGPRHRGRPRRCLALAFVLSLALCGVSRAQLVVMLPSEFSPATVPPKRRPATRLPARERSAPLDEAKLKTVIPPAEPAALVRLESDPPLSLMLSSFSAGATDGGAELSRTSWAGNITQNATSITVGGTARDENGWGASSLSLDASAMNFLTISARRDAGNAAPVLFVQFEDALLRTYVVSLNTSLFSSTTFTPVSVPLAAWTVDFGPAQITGWSIGGGGLGTMDFRLTFDSLALTTSAIPEPGTYAALLGALSLAVAWRRRVTSNTSPARRAPR